MVKMVDLGACLALHWSAAAHVTRVLAQTLAELALLAVCVGRCSGMLLEPVLEPSFAEVRKLGGLTCLFDRRGSRDEDVPGWLLGTGETFTGATDE